MEFTVKQQVFLAEVCRFFHENAEWPTYRYLDRRLHGEMNVAKVGEELERFMADYLPFAPRTAGFEPTRKVSLGIGALYTCQADIYANFKELLDAFALTVSMCAEAYDANEDDEQAPKVTSTEMRQRKSVSDLTLRQVSVLMATTNLWQSMNPAYTGDVAPGWEITVADAIREYRDVHTIEDFLEQRRRLTEEWQARATGFTSPFTRLQTSPLSMTAPPELQADIVEDSAAVAVDRLHHFVRRFSRVAVPLAQRYSRRPGFLIVDEYDVQDLFYAILQLEFDDVRREEPLPSHAGAASRIDFLLADHGVAIEVKMPRPSLSQRALRDELLVDFALYHKHPQVKYIVAFVYDPAKRVRNPPGFEKDLSGPFEGIPVRVMVVQG